MPDEHYHGTSAALEFAVQALEVKHIVVLGHATCGGVKAYANRAKPLSPGDFIGKWVSLVGQAESKAGDPGSPDYLTRLEYAVVTQGLENLMTFPFVKERVDDGRLELHGAHFGVASGSLLVRDPQTGQFVAPIDRNRPAGPLGRRHRVRLSPAAGAAAERAFCPAAPSPLERRRLLRKEPHPFEPPSPPPRIHVSPPRTRAEGTRASSGRSVSFAVRRREMDTGSDRAPVQGRAPDP